MDNTRPVHNASFAFPSEKRILDKRAYQRVFQQGKRCRGGLLTLIHCKTALTHPRLGLVIPKRHIKHAVNRNTVKRLIREFFRVNQSQLPGVDIVVLTQIPMKKIEKQQLHEELSKQWKKIRQAFSVSAVCL